MNKNEMWKQKRETGRKGEQLFNDHLLNKNSTIHKRLRSIRGFKSKVTIKWMNEDKESSLPFDFIINKKMFDVKTTTANMNTFTFSKNQLGLIMSGSLYLVLINMKTYEDNKKRKIKKNWLWIYTPKEVLEKCDFSIYPREYNSQKTD